MEYMIYRPKVYDCFTCSIEVQVLFESPPSGSPRAPVMRPALIPLLGPFGPHVLHREDSDGMKKLFSHHPGTSCELLVGFSLMFWWISVAPNQLEPYLRMFLSIFSC